MMFPRIGRSISQISRSRNALSGGNGGRSQILTDSSSSDNTNCIHPNQTTSRFFHSLQKKQKSSTGQKVAFIILAPLVITGLYSYFMSLKSDFDTQIQKLRSVNKKIAKLKEEIPYEWKLDADEEEE